VNINRVKSAAERWDDLEKDELKEPLPHIFHGIVDVPGDLPNTEPLENVEGRRYPLRNRRPPDRLTYTEF